MAHLLKTARDRAAIPQGCDVYRQHGANRPLACSECKFRRESVFSGLSGSQLDRLEQAMQATSYPKGAVIFFEGDTPRAVYCLCRGRVKLLRSSPDGKAVIVRIAEPGDVLGAAAILANKPYDVTAEALEPCQLKYMGRDDFLRFVKGNGQISLRLAEKLSGELYKAYSQVRDMGCKVPALARLARLLLELSNASGESASEGIRLKMSLSREEIAEMIGTSRETASRLLSELMRRGAIKVDGRSLVILNRTLLEDELQT